jgi:hypothetical protein
MNEQTKKIVVTEALRKGLYALLEYGNSELNFEIADRVLRDYPQENSERIIEAIEDAQEFIRQIAISGSTAIPFEGATR